LVLFFKKELLACLLSACFVSRAFADEATFFKGRSMFMVIGYSAGGGYDLYARVLAQYLGKHIPGQPTILPQSMPGAGSLKAANYIYSVAPKDGTVIGTFARGMPLDPLLIGNAKFDGRKFTWLGSITKDTSVCVTWKASPIATWADLLSKDSKFGGEGAGSDPDIFANVLRTMFGAKVKLITGYPGTADMTLAMERGEIDGLCGISWSTIVSRHPEWISGHLIHVLVQAALQSDPALPGVPLMSDETGDARNKEMLKLILAPQVMARPIAAPLGLPPERAAALQNAFAETMQDPAFLADMKRQGLDVAPVTPAAIDALLADLYAAPPDVVRDAAHATGG
jgi:tripartite-type tricarboxylate transporter receptor subunit TctC